MSTNDRTYALHKLSTKELRRAERAIRHHLTAMSAVAHTYPDDSYEIQADADALGLVLAIVHHELRRSEHEDDEAAYLNSPLRSGT